MDPRLIDLYRKELEHLHGMGAEFAAQFPKIAARLRMDGLDVADPYVERLLQGCAFLTARVQLRLDAEFPRFTHRLLEIVYPNLLAPVPSMLVAQLQPELGDAGLAAGVRLARGTPLHGAIAGSTTPCRFVTGTDTTLWPLEVADAAYFAHAANLPLAAMPEWRSYGGGVRLRLRATAGLDFSQIALDALRLHFAGPEDGAWRLHELVCGHALGAFVLPAGRRGAAAMTTQSWHTLDADDIRGVGFEPGEALLPSALPGLDGWRLLQEHFAFPQRFLFADLHGLGDALRALGGSEAEVVILFARGDATLQRSVEAASFALHCVPAVNLFERRCDRIAVTPQTHDFHLVVDRTRPMDFEVHGVREVEGHGAAGTGGGVRRFHPFYAAFHDEPADHGAYFSVQREPRLLSSAQQRDGPRSSYVGTEVFLSIVDGREAPYPATLQQLGVTALCTNRDLPLLLPPGGALKLDATAPVKAVKIVRGPSRPLTPLADGSAAWRFVNQLSLNHLSLLDADARQGAAALRDMLRLHVHGADPAHARQVDGVRSVRTSPVVRRLPMAGPIAFGRGVRIDVEVDELAFQGASAFLLGQVLGRFFARHVSMNGFTETHLHSASRGEILNGRPQVGTRPTL